ncbi:MAG TPA: hypothetical protein VN922_17720 [Bacteroidia bacterium]|nr:hypothetical protein [Bacteroidia bacterium]
MTKKEQAEREVEDARAELHKLVKPGDKVYTILRHVSASGMSRVIDPFIVMKGKNIPLHLGWYAERLLGYKRSDRYVGVKVGGAGMDMGFHLVYELSRSLYPMGFDCIGEGCPANDHFNGENVKYHKDGGYALRQEWF